MSTKSIGPAAGCTGLGHLKTNLFISDYVKNNPRFFIREISRLVYSQYPRGDKQLKLRCDAFDCNNKRTLKVIIQSSKTGQTYARNYCYRCACKSGFSTYLFEKTKEEE
jgi:hypothetical protein